MIDYGTFRFAAPPRMATGWFCKAAEIAGLEMWPNNQAWGEGPPHSSKLVVTVVRHPATWLGSYYYWAKGEATGCPYVDRLRPLAIKHTFLAFVEKVTEAFPGFIWGMHVQYNANVVLRVDDFPWAAMEFFASIGTPRDRLDEIQALPPLNVRRGHPVPPLSKALLARLVASENEFCKRYDY